MSFTELLIDAFSQFQSGEDEAHFVPKITNGTVQENVQFSGSLRPFIIEVPIDITEIFDTFGGIRRTASEQSEWPPQDRKTTTSVRCEGSSLVMITRSVALERVVFTRQALPDLVFLWTSTANVITHIVQCSPSGPCTGPSRMVETDEALLDRYFTYQFSGPAALEWAAGQGKRLLIPHGVVGVDNMDHVSDKDFGLYLERYMACHVCGTTPKTAEKILLGAEFRCVTTIQGKLLALINKSHSGTIGPDGFISSVTGTLTSNVSMLRLILQSMVPVLW